MSTEEFSRPLFKKRFKGIENFLKRIAFNLGNTPSQTEVKIISCIPIDVTDLQQKIIHLEKELEDANAALQGFQAEDPGRPNKSYKHLQHRFSKNKSVINTTPENLSKNVFEPTNADQPGTPDSTEPYYGHPAAKTNNISQHNQTVKPYNMDKYSSQPITPRNMDNYYSQPAKSYNMKHWCHAPKICESKPNYERQTYPKKTKKLFKHKKKSSPYVYYSQTYSSPFIKSNLTEEVPKHEEPDVMTRTYLAAMVSRQYKPEILGDDISLHTEFSSPICRDVQSRCEGNCHVVSDVCSCCHGPFQNIDEHRNKQNTFQSYMVGQINTGSAFYNTDQYDLVPVKEKPVKNKKDSERPRKKEPRPYMDMKCWPENVRTKYRYQSFPLTTSNHYTARPRADYTEQRHRRLARDMSDQPNSYGRKMLATFNSTEPVARILPKRRMCRRERSINIETSKSCCIDFGNIYPKKNMKIAQKLERSQPIPVPKKNAECLTTVIDSHECQTEMSNMEVPSADSNKTEVTLNQIKSILQSVLAEVKVSSQTKSQAIQNKPQKDAVVQKGPSRNNMQASSLMNSITYSPYAMNVAPYVPSCSRQMSPNQFCYNPHGGLKCYHNFPVFIQTPGGRHMCSSCYRSSQIKPGVLRQATTTATNTEQVKAQHNRETDKLIKEVYKSMALTIDFPLKETSLSEYNEPMKSLHGFTSPVILKTEQKKQPKIIRNVMGAVSELFMKKDMIETSDTFNSTADSKATSHEASVQSHAVTSTDTELRTKQDRLKYMHAKHKQPVEPEVDKKTFRGTMAQNANSITESESSSSEPDTDTTMLHQRQVQKVASEQLEHKHFQKKGKEGLLTKMFKSVKLFKTKEKPKTLPKRVEKKDDESEEDTTSDSDDYQTVYSQKIEKNLRQRSRPHNLPKRKTHSKISYKQTYQRDRSPEKRRSPYMEQENRRCWDENLMFHNNNPRYSSERHYSEQSSSQNPAYYKAYEARTVLVEPRAHVPAIEPRSNRASNNESQPARKPASKGIAWLRKHKMGIRCGPQWKQLILEG